jgi:hypothetical protein
LLNVIKNWPENGTKISFELQQSFSESRDVAEWFMASAESGKAKAPEAPEAPKVMEVMFEVVSDRGTPIASVSAIENEAEHLMRNGERYRILGVKRESEKDNKGPYTVTLGHLEPGIEEVDYEFGV